MKKPRIIKIFFLGFRQKHKENLLWERFFLFSNNRLEKKILTTGISQQK